MTRGARPRAALADGAPRAQEGVRASRAQGAVRAPREALAVGHGQVHVWLLRTPPCERDVQDGELDAAERRRAAAYRKPDDRRLYVAAHVGLRRVLAAYTGLAPDRLRMGRDPCPREARPREARPGEAGPREARPRDACPRACPRERCGREARGQEGTAAPHGRPVLLGVPGAPQFSLSHSHGLALVAVAARRVGADVQRLPSAATVAQCLPALHPAERDEIAQLPASARPVAFGRLWTRKEAYLKGLGTGLTRRAHADYLGERECGDARRPPGWTVRNLPPLSPGHSSAVALAGGGDVSVTARWIRADWLYAPYAPYTPDASADFARARPALRTTLPAHRVRTEGARA